MSTLIFVPLGDDNIWLGKCELTDARPQVGDEIQLEFISANLHLIDDPRKMAYANFRVVSVCWDLKNTLITESWMPAKEMYIPGKTAYAYVRVEPLDEATRAYIDRIINYKDE